ncbi:MAG: hypothetical protein QOE90_3163 [Thermoplasmata archaeon]|jgi:hypothetical protein|nr:hypothetical protein [Thermoplasmata archaeon]
MRLALVFLALAVLLAGCAAPGAVPQPVQSASTLPASLAGEVHVLGGGAIPAAAPLPARGLQLSTGASGGEPTLGIDSKGRIFAEAFQAGEPTIMRSEDHGLTWKDVGPTLPTGQHAPPQTLDPYMYLDPTTGRVYKNENDAECAILSWTDDAGATWTTSPVGCGVGAGVPIADHQSMVAAKPRMLPVSPLYPNVVYSCTNTGVTTECATSLNGGYTFGPVVTVFPQTTDPTDCPGDSLGHPVTDKDGRVFLAHGGCNRNPTIGVTEDDGLTWTSHVIAKGSAVINSGVVHDVNLAVDDNGTVYAGWISDKGLPTYAWSKDHGVTWAPALVVSPPEVTAAAFPALAAGADGRLVFAYVATTIPGGYAGKQTGPEGTVTDIASPAQDPPEWANASWNGYLTVMTDAKDAHPVATTVTANDPANPLARGVCGKTRCGGMDDFIDAAIDPQGRPYAVFVDVCNEKCVTDPTVHKMGNVLTVGTLAEGPALRGALEALPPLADPSAL